MNEPKSLKPGDAEENYFKRRAKQFALVEDELQGVAKFPKNALVELTNGCNHACIFCKNSNQTREVKHLDFETFDHFVKQAVGLGLEEVGLYATGEPFMTKDLDRYIKNAKSNGLKRVYITTNGALASLEKVISCHEAGLDSIKFSITASNAKEYKLVHGQNDIEKVRRNVENIYEWKLQNNADLQLICSCVIIPAFPDTEERHREIFGKYFEDIQYVKSGSQGGQAFELEREFGEELQGVFHNLTTPVPTESIKPCEMLWNRYHLTSEGYLTACAVDYELDLVFANLQTERLDQAWNNETMRMLREVHINKTLDGLLCDQCLHNRPAPYQPLTKVQKSAKSMKALDTRAQKLLKRIQITKV